MVGFGRKKMPLGRGQSRGDMAIAEILPAEPPSPMEIAAELGEPCPACGAPREGQSRFCVACGSPLTAAPEADVVSGESGADTHAVPDRTFECQNCGSQVATSVDQRSYVCPFCDSTYVTEIPVERSGRQRPEFVIGFAITAQQAEEKFFKWLSNNSWFRPGDLKVKAIAERQKGVYLPFWHFAVHSASRWSASIGEYWYRTETYTTKDAKGKTVRRTRQVREVEWFPLSGRYHRYYHGYLVPASTGITASEAQAIQPFRLSALTRYRPYFLAGWMAEEYSVDMDSAIEQTKAEFRRRQEAEIARFLPGDTHRSLSVTTHFEVNGSDLILLPVHVLSYRYQDKVYRFLVNGQTGKVIGEKPWSAKRIGFFIGFCVVLLAIIALVIFLLTRS
jgi:hypothetical protein